MGDINLCNLVKVPEKKVDDHKSHQAKSSGEVCRMECGFDLVVALESLSDNHPHGHHTAVRATSARGEEKRKSLTFEPLSVPCLVQLLKAVSKTKHHWKYQ